MKTTTIITPVFKLSLKGNIKGTRFVAFNSTKIRKTYFRALLDVPYNFVADYFRKGYFFKLLKDILLLSIILFIVIAIVALVANLPELGKALN